MVFERVSASQIVATFAQAGYRLINVHYYKLRREGQAAKYTLVAQFGTTQGRVSSAGLRAFGRLSANTWGKCFVYDNGEGKPYTVNFTGRLPDEKPQRHICIVNGGIEDVSVAPAA